VRARRAVRVFDIVYVYCGMGYLPYEFLLVGLETSAPIAYGGQRAQSRRIVARSCWKSRRAGSGDRCAVALRNQSRGAASRPQRSGAIGSPRKSSSCYARCRSVGREAGLIAPNDLRPSRFAPEGSHEPIIGFVKSSRQAGRGLGSFTSPDTWSVRSKRRARLMARRALDRGSVSPRKSKGGAASRDISRAASACNI